jgi:hypothetical protein
MASPMSRQQLLAVRPSDYLKNGFVDGAGAPQPALLGMTPFAVATQLVQGEASPQETAITLQAIREVLPDHAASPPGERLEGAVNEALPLVAGMLGISNNIVLAGWIAQCLPFVKTDQDISAFLEHFQTVLLQHNALVMVNNIGPDGPEAPPPAP